MFLLAFLFSSFAVAPKSEEKRTSKGVNFVEVDETDSQVDELVPIGYTATYKVAS